MTSLINFAKVDLSRMKTALISLEKYEAYLLSVLSTIFFYLLKVNQYNRYEIGFELADFETLVWNTINGRFLEYPSTGLSFLGEHFSPILILLVPIYLIINSPHALLFSQAFFLGIAIIPLYFIARKLTNNRLASLAFCLSFSVSRVVNYGLMYDFHFEAFYPVIIFSAFLSIIYDRWSYYY